MQKNNKSNIEIQKDVEQTMEDVKELRNTVYGNGNKGLKERVTIIETNFAAVGTSIKITGAVLGIIQIVIGIAITFVTAALNSGKTH